MTERRRPGRKRSKEPRLPKPTYLRVKKNGKAYRVRIMKHTGYEAPKGESMYTVNFHEEGTLNVDRNRSFYQVTGPNKYVAFNEGMDEWKKDGYRMGR